MLPSRCSQPPCRNWLVTSVAVSAATGSRRGAQAAVRSAGTTPHAVMNASSAASPPLASDAELPGEDDEAGDDQRERDDRRPPRRVRVPERDHGAAPARQGFLVGFGVALADAGPARADGLGRRRRRVVRDGHEDRLVDAVARHPDERRRAPRRRRATTYIAAEVRPSRRRRRRAGTGRCTCRPTLSIATIRRVRRS